MQNKDLIHKLIEIGAVVDDEKAETLLMAVGSIGKWDILKGWLIKYKDEPNIDQVLHKMNELERKYD